MADNRGKAEGVKTDPNIYQNRQNKAKGNEDPVCSVECSVCLQPCIHPVQLQCTHIFCFLCVKGAAHRSKRCALCRQEIDPRFFDNPKLLRYDDLERTTKFDNQYQWFYQGGNGWWQYDDRTSQELELQYKNGEKVFEILIAGFLYIIDFENMVQLRRNDRSRKRKIRRDLVSIPGVKGVAGLKFSKSPPSSRPVGDGNEQSSQSSIVLNQTALPSAVSSTPNTPTNTPQTPASPVDSPPSSVQSSQQDLTAQLQSLNLGDCDSVNDEVNQTRHVPNGRDFQSDIDTDSTNEDQDSVLHPSRPVNPVSNLSRDPSVNDLDSSDTTSNENTDDE